MDIATLIGLISGIAIITGAIASGGSLLIFLNLPGLMIVLGGTLAATLIKFPLSHCFKALHVAAHALREEVDHPLDLIRTANRLAYVVRNKNGLLGLEDEPIDNAFFHKGVQLAMDGHPPDFVRNVLQQDLQQSLERHDIGQKIFRAVGESAPAFGMIGTLIGLVQMLTNLENPSSIGPAMAIALLTTLYGALIANLIALPIADKLELRARQEQINKQLIIDSMHSIQQGQNPRIMDDILEAYLPSLERDKLREPPPASEREQETD